VNFDYFKKIFKIMDAIPVNKAAIITEIATISGSKIDSHFIKFLRRV